VEFDVVCDGAMENLESESVGTEMVEQWFINSVQWGSGALGGR
jgi:hypothetical protein